MQQIWIPTEGAPDVLEVRTAPDPTPGPGEVRIQVEASGLNFADLMGRMGLYPDRPALPCVMGYEVAGTIDAVGAGVPRARVGEAVVAMTRFGGHSSAVCVPEVQAVVRPEKLDAITAASIPVNALTAWMMLEEMGRVRKGDRVLVHSAGGGVGLAALDLLLWRGAHAIGTASPGKHAFLKERGYHELIDYRNNDFAEVLKDEPGLDLVLDPIGGDYWKKGMGLLRAGGRMICFGFSKNAGGDTRNLLSTVTNLASVPWLKFNPIHLMNENIGVMGVNMGHMWHESERVSGWLEKLLILWQQGVLRPRVHATVPFSNAKEAHRILHDRENLGKVILVPDP
jgi:NADPH:quinone reductase-like Zn-dependent oxidoreductase